MITLATLATLQRELGLQTGDETRLLFALQVATAALHSASSRKLLPLIQAQTVARSAHDPAALALSDDLLEVLSVSDQGSTLHPEQLVHSLDGSLRRIDSLPFSGDERGEVTVNALWGYHPQADQAWQTVTTLASALADDALTLVAATVGSTNDPLFSPGQLVRIGDELLAVHAVDFDTASVTVGRGVRGSTAVAHGDGTLIQQYVPPADLVRLCVRIAHRIYREGDDPAQDMLLELADAVRSFRRIRV